MTDIIDKHGNSINAGDEVLLFNWSIKHPDEVIGRAKIVWNGTYHKWDMQMISGDYIEDEDDRWLKCKLLKVSR